VFLDCDSHESSTFTFAELRPSSAWLTLLTWRWAFHGLNFLASCIRNIVGLLLGFLIAIRNRAQHLYLQSLDQDKCVDIIDVVVGISGADVFGKAKG
jgi:hypothetical protein